MLARTPMLPDPDAIAAGVAKTARHIEIERELATLRQAAEKHRERQRGLDRDGKIITAIQRDVEQLGDQMRPLRRELADLREKHGERIAAALAPARRQLATRDSSMSSSRTRNCATL